MKRRAIFQKKVADRETTNNRHRSQTGRFQKRVITVNSKGDKALVFMRKENLTKAYQSSVLSLNAHSDELKNSERITNSFEIC